MDFFKASEKEVKDIYYNLQLNFSIDEIRSFSSHEKLFLKDNYNVYYLIDENKKVGLIILWDFPDFAFLEYLLIFEEYRNLGYGSIALKILKKRYKRIVLEAERPIDIIKKRRIDFYLRNGFYISDKEYVQPSYGENKNSVDMYLLTYPRKMDCLNIVKEIYKEVYNKA